MQALDLTAELVEALDAMKHEAQSLTRFDFMRAERDFPRCFFHLWPSWK